MADLPIEHGRSKFFLPASHDSTEAAFVWPGFPHVDAIGSRSEFCTSDGAVLSLLEAGQGDRTLLMLPGWSQTAALFAWQLRDLSSTFRCIAVDQRGHGESQDVAHGYVISRLATDLRELILAKDLCDLVLLGHSMAAAVIWAYWDAYGSDRLAAVLLVDQPACLLERDTMSQEAREQAGAIFTLSKLREQCDALVSQPVAATRDMIGGMLGPDFPSAWQEWVVQENLKFPRIYAAELLMNAATHDWRDVIPCINIPALVIGGAGSSVPWRSQAWISEKIPGSQLIIFEAENGGSHFMFLENPRRFNTLVNQFILGLPALHR